MMESLQKLTGSGNNICLNTLGYVTISGRARVSPLHRSQVVGVEGGRPRLERCCSAAGRRGGAVAEEVRRLGLEESGG
jgi:hypothetical protein